MVDKHDPRYKHYMNLIFEICFGRECRNCPLRYKPDDCFGTKYERGEKFYKDFYKDRSIEEIIGKAYADLFPARVGNIPLESKILFGPEFAITEDELMNMLEM